MSGRVANERFARPLNIVIVDDERLVREALERYFNGLGHETHTVASAPECLRALGSEKAPFELAFVDLDLRGDPGAGAALVRALRAPPHWVSVVLMTGHASAALARAALSEWADDAVLKPIALLQLGLCLERAADRVDLVRSWRAAAQGADFPPQRARRGSILSAAAEHLATEPLSRAELATLALLINGKPIKMIASDRCVALETVRSQRRSVYRKVDVHSQEHLCEKLESHVRSCPQCAALRATGRGSSSS